MVKNDANSVRPLTCKSKGGIKGSDVSTNGRVK